MDDIDKDVTIERLRAELAASAEVLKQAASGFAAIAATYGGGYIIRRYQSGCAAAAKRAREAANGQN